ncbi:hypothetical protein TFKS16_1894 [Tannerella forsythia KS16]|jgi:hypothetical protein|uniref:Uncharacterized protein n=3 Tax=Tannerella forsythia TaxID=28112 RepID=A0A1D3UV79_TANFO|nr:hypothetical protein [Tannerella forsythia]SCQ21808.1 hypothetical protein TFUB4_01799 [Tannerella forsythia]SCQ22767.1 hypothetical protein TFUB20_01824 [Tannerella forsythia]SCQ23941.1 hypothetical protein TFUB22_01791 [Tannerella forsythia]BAR49415.1 hypothetical protein TF3313_1941 [Tannerella forsythia 3313]BAR52117.1 hypothetical protein TFKS16_1894 [Tannerella forsythia KS16]
MTESCIFKYFFLLLLQFWYEMAGKEMELCAVLDVRLQDLLTLCDEQDQKIKDLSETIRQMKEEYRILNARYTDMLTATSIAFADGGEKKEAKRRLSELVREVDRCLALLNG